ncbi:MAG: SIMPL domain-containing protein [Cellulomonadaceae bacterium]|jgi:uncharacterized protein YggE|nr:SIMPL domain-containing protein [Cellulomonadaceae bacterium]
MLIRIQGQSRLTFPPNLARAHLSVSCEGTNKAATVDSATTALAGLVDATNALVPSAVSMVVSDQLRVSSYTPQDNKGHDLPTKYAASASVTAEFTDLTAILDFLKEQAVIQGIHVSWVRWLLTDESQAAADEAAQVAAVADARVKAERYARAAGGGPVVPVVIADAGMLGIERSSRNVDPMGSAPIMAAKFGSSEPDIHQEFQPEDVIVTCRIDAEFTSDYQDQVPG